MRSPEYEARLAEVKRRAHGRWTEILAHLGVDPKLLLRRNQPCPLCGGTDRFQYTDKFGEGNYHCRACGAGGGFKLLQAARGVDFATALAWVESCVGAPLPPAPDAAPSPARLKRLAQRLWQEATPVHAGDAVAQYLAGRGLALPAYPGVLRLHPALGYFEKDDGGRSRQVAAYPAMLACVQGSDGHAVSLHRTYLKDGAKAPVAEPKKVLSAGINGAAVRLFAPGPELAVAEGIETALAVHLATGKPVWAGLSAGNLEKLWIPPTVERVCIYADNDADADFDGEAYAYALARRLRKAARNGAPRSVRVFVPRTPGQDWADVWGARHALAPTR